MAIRQTKISDLDGAEDADYTAVVREYPGVNGGKVLDITKEQSEALAAKAVKDVVTIELRSPDTSSRAVHVSRKDLDAWLGKPEVLEKAAGIRGRRPGFSPGNGTLV